MMFSKPEASELQVPPKCSFPITDCPFTAARSLWPPPSHSDHPTEEYLANTLGE